jgi:uncharacterized protein YbaR (Trm112 family)
MEFSKLLKILCCPETHQSLELAEPTLLARLNAQIQAGVTKNRAGEVVTTPIENGFVRQDRTILYPVRKNIPVMLIDEGIPLTPS